MGKQAGVRDAGIDFGKLWLVLSCIGLASAVFVLLMFRDETLPESESPSEREA